MAPEPGASRRSRRFETAARLLCLGVALAAALGFVFIPGALPAHADAASNLTVNWANDSGAAASYQPARSTSGLEYNEFKNIQVSVDQTQNIGDQAVSVSISGFQSGTKGVTDPSTGQFRTDSMNFMQAMQCWGADPLAADFVQTCEWGGRFFNQNNGLGESVYPDNVERVADKDMDPAAANPTDNPYQLYQGDTITGREISTPDPDHPTDASKNIISYPIADYYNVSTTNEVESVRINDDGTSSFDFEAQSDQQAPQMGCGRDSHLRCWLVLVPRGTIYGGHDESCSLIRNGAAQGFSRYSYGETNAIQAGSPVNPACNYWQNRIDIPLDFNPTANTCQQGNTERRLIGSQMLIGAMASWQSQLCANLNTTYSFSTNPDSVAREQLLDGGQGGAGLAFASYPITPAEVADNDTSLAELQASTLSYAPVAATSAVVAYLAEGPSGRIDDLKLSPRLMAKLLTQSYTFLVPHNSEFPVDDLMHLGAVNKSYSQFNQDPDFQALNPDWAKYSSNPAIVLPGPDGADAIRQIWKWIESDAAASAWLGGAPDPWGMTINPYYLPKGNPAAKVPVFDANADLEKDGSGNTVYKQVGLSNLDGSPLSLANTVLDDFPKADSSIVPKKLSVERYAFGTLQYEPYAANFISAAQTTFRADPGAKTVWDPNAIDSAGDRGDWVSGGPQLAGQRFMISISDDPSAQLYDLDTAALQLDNSTDFEKPTNATLASALNSSALVPTALPAVSQIDPSKVAAGGYPLTMLIYAIVNLGQSDASALHDFSRMIAQVTTSGQVLGSQPGELPVGYLPLPSALASQAAAAAAAIAAYVPPTSPPSTTGPAQDDGGNFTSGDGSDGSGGAGAGSPGGTVSAASAEHIGRTPASHTVPIVQASLGISLAAGLLGAFCAPLLFRGRRFT